MTDLTAEWTGPYGLPPFGRFAPADFPPAFDRALAEHRAEIAAIKADPAPADFRNTVAALERAGRSLSRVASVFFTLAGSDTTPEIQEIERAIAPRLAAHRNAILMDPALWARVRSVPEDGLGAEEARVLALTRRRFRKAGAELDDAGRARLAEIGERLATLGTAFAQAVLADEQGWTLTLGADDRAGLSADLLSAAWAEGAARGIDAPVITLSRSLVEPFLEQSDRRDLRAAAWRAWTGRGEGTTWPIIAETLALRAEKARLLGFDSFAAWKLSDQMAKTPEAVEDLLMRVWHPARTQAEAEAAHLSAMAAEAGMNGPLEPWDWRYWAAKRRAAAFDESAAKPYLPLDSVIAAAFDVAHRLFGLTFREVTGAALPHPDARAWEVRREDAFLGLFIGDYFARPSKRSGAWASALAPAQALWEPGHPIILNTMNFAKGDPTLLSPDDARTLFHEFGHALHGLMSEVTYPSISGTNVARDFVELPSQLYEHWLTEPAILRAHARHWETGAAMPEAMIAGLRAAERRDQAFRSVEYLGSALVDLAMHRIPPDALTEPREMERAELARIGMPRAIAMRHRSPHFLHVFAGDGYSAGYYSYLWSEMMDADAFRAFEETGDSFDAATAGRLARHVLAAGARAEPEDLYTAFRGAMPGVEPLLEGRGLA